LRQKLADQTISAAEAEFEAVMRRGLAEVKRLYYDALLARYNVEVAADNRQTFDQLVQFNLTRFEEGAIPELDLIKVRLERMKFESSVRQADLALRQATIRLLRKLGLSPNGRTFARRRGKSKQPMRASSWNAHVRNRI
jgi:outer membrane protein TolC